MNSATLAIPMGLDRPPAPPPAPAQPSTTSQPSSATPKSASSAAATSTKNGQATGTSAPGFRKVSGGESEMQSGYMLMVEAYAIMWLLVFGFVWLSGRRQSGLDERIERLGEDLQTLRDADGNGDNG